ncbi:PilZ domain-containing protein [bacterium]|nr:MAG: PilZ domain-containing protein [bacterium]
MAQLMEKRKDTLRIALDSNIWIRDTADEGSPLVHGRIRNLSEGGIKFVVSESFGENSLLDMMIDTGHGLVRAWGRVAHENMASSERFETGVAFFEFDLYARQAISRILALNA